MELDALNRTLKDLFGHGSLFPAQADAILAQLRGRDCFVLMATGGGKSVCYQLPVLYKRATTGQVECSRRPLLPLPAAPASGPLPVGVGGH